MELRKIFKCPDCGYHLCYRKDDRICCLRTGCEWSIEAKRKEDQEIPTIAQMRADEGEA